jgi:predicted acetyltransferase
MPDLQLRPIRPDEVDAHVGATAEAFYAENDPEVHALWARECEPERTLDVFDGDDIVGTSALLTRELTVPGATVPMAGVTSVGVRADRRRQGLLGRMMRGQLEAIRDRGEEAVAALWASDTRIYGRYGFGLAARTADLTVRSPRATLRTPPAGRPRLAEPAAVREELVALHESVRVTRPGMLARGPAEWEMRIADPARKRDGRGPLRAVLVEGGYALWSIRSRRDGDGDVEVREIVASDPVAHAALWGFLLDLELTRTVHWEDAPSDEPLGHMLLDARAARITLGDSLWIRLVDVRAALEQRTYAAPLDVVLEVEDAVFPHNAGRLRLSGGPDGAACAPTGDAPGLALGAVELGAAYLGGTPLGVLAAAGRVQELSPGALAAADVAFRAAREPWCPEVF